MQKSVANSDSFFNKLRTPDLIYKKAKSQLREISLIESLLFRAMKYCNLLKKLPVARI